MRAYYLILCGAFAFCFLFFSPLTADTIFLDDGSVLIGKVVEKKDDVILFKNMYGVFTIKNNQISKQYLTDDYREDLTITRKLGLKMSEDEIRKNVEAGLKDPRSQKTVSGSEHNATVRITAFGLFGKTTGKFNELLPLGYGGMLAVDYSPGNTIASERHWYVPWLRVETGYLMFDKKENSIRGVPVNGGLLWNMPLSKSSAFAVTAGVMPGISFLTVKNNESSTSTSKICMQSLFGFEYSVSTAIFCIHARYLHIYDTEISLRSVFFSAGMGYRF